MATNGRQWRLKIKTPSGDYVTFAGATEESMTVDNQAVDVTDKESDGYRHLLENAGRSVDLSLSCVAIQGQGYNLLLQAVRSNSFVDMRAEAAFSAIEGTFHPSNYNESGTNAQAVSFSASFQSAGRYNFLIPVQLIGQGFLDPVMELDRPTTQYYYDANGVERSVPPQTPAFAYAQDGSGDYRGFKKGYDGTLTADVSGVIDQTQGVLQIITEPIDDQFNEDVFTLSDGTDQNRIRCFQGNGVYQFELVSGGTVIATLNTQAPRATGSPVQLILLYTDSVFAAVPVDVPGGQAVAKSIGALPSGLTQLTIHNGQWIRGLQYVPRAVPVAYDFSTVDGIDLNALVDAEQDLRSTLSTLDNY